MSGESGRIIDVTPAGASTQAGGPPSGLVNVGHAVYACFAIGFFVGFTWLVGVIIAYVKRDDARGTWMESHFSWIIRTFWWSIVWTIVGGILFVTIIGIVLAWIVWGIAWLWALYRVIKGWIRLNGARAV
nr:putative transmembrane protein [uncultured bacterium]